MILVLEFEEKDLSLIGLDVLDLVESTVRSILYPAAGLVMAGRVVGLGLYGSVTFR